MSTSALPAPLLRGRPWFDDAVALVAATAALGVVLLAPRLLPDTDPVGVDPFSARLGAVALMLLGAAVVLRGLRAARPVLLAVAAVVLPFVLWAATPRALVDVFGDRASGNTGVLVANVVQLAATLMLIAAALHTAPPGWRPALRLRRLGAAATLACVGGVVALVVAGLAAPAPLLGREGVPLVAVQRDLPLLGPAFALQAVAQELQFRGLLLGTLERAAPPWLANLGQASLFGLAHVAVQYEGPAGPFVPITVALGLALGWVTQRTGSLWPAIVIHVAAELAVAVAVLDGLYGY